ncbi:MAG: SHOCT domain-containing protein [Anaerolineae bacterium]|nr:SHOCT domain-containing protein [Anaerolineae bacterium]
MRLFGGGILMVVIGVVVLGGLIWLVSALARTGGAPTRVNEAPLEILKRRYAIGEIDREEFERIRASLVS